MYHTYLSQYVIHSIFWSQPVYSNHLFNPEQFCGPIFIVNQTGSTEIESTLITKRRTTHGVVVYT